MNEEPEQKKSQAKDKKVKSRYAMLSVSSPWIWGGKCFTEQTKSNSGSPSHRNNTKTDERAMSTEKANEEGRRPFEELVLICAGALFEALFEALLPVVATPAAVFVVLGV
jgi:hypothetical protein